MERDDALNEAIQAVGGYTDVGAALGISPSAVHQWRKTPLHWVKRLSEISGVPTWRLAPDHYDAPVSMENE